jgi:hypothetical protein
MFLKDSSEVDVGFGVGHFLGVGFWTAVYTGVFFMSNRIVAYSPTSSRHIGDRYVALRCLVSSLGFRGLWSNAF